MQLTIGSKTYFANPAAITLLRYRAIFGTSFVSEFLMSGKNANSALVKLAYAAIEDGQRPDWPRFASQASSEKGFLDAALALVREVMRAPQESTKLKKLQNQKEDIQDSDLDEIRILSMCMDCGAPDWLFLRFPVFFVVDVLVHIASDKNQEMKSAGKKKYVPMTPSQIRNLYL